MCEDAVYKLAGHLGCALGMVVECGDGGEDCGSCFCCQLHVAEMDAIEGGLAHAENERATLLEADVRGAMDEVAGEAIGDGSKGSHGAGEDDHGGCGIASTGDAGPDICIGVLTELLAGCAE